jgi:16S rRNA (guanine527-N7)-methyltransferase
LTELTKSFLQLKEQEITACWRHYESLLKWNRAINLTTVTDLESAVERHYAESIFLASFLPNNVRRVADVGSGAGFPGFPCAAIRPQSHFWLIESVGKKAAFLREAAALPNISVLAMRAEDCPLSFDCVVSRAVRPRDVVKWAEQFSARTLLLIGREDAVQLKGFSLNDLPWGKNRVLAIR